MNNALNILYVEDCEVTVELLRLCMTKYYSDDDITLDVAGNVSEAIDIFSAETHVAALIDWNLPDGAGTQVAEHIRLSHKTIPLIFLSAHFTEDHLLQAKQYNPSDCLIKDYSKAFIEKIVRHMPEPTS